MNRKLLFAVAAFVAMLLPLALAGQGKEDSGTISVTGCLNKGPDASHFLLKEESGKEYVVTGNTVMLSGHANNHRVTITGSMTKERNQDVLKATNLQMLALCRN
jgi:hypothetical protein